MTPSKPIFRRLSEIDMLRAVGIIVIMMTHVYSKHLGNAFDFALWNNLHFVVVGFIFSSGYVLTNKYQHSLTTVQQTLHWYKKRIIHLVVPFYWYLLAHYTLWYMFPGLFNGLELKKNLHYVAQSLIFYDGISLNWITLLFIQLMVIFPILMWMMNTKRKLFALYTICAAASAVYFVMYRFPYDHYRSVMWLPWSLIFLLGAYISQIEKNTNNAVRTMVYFKVGVAALSVYSLLWLLLDMYQRAHVLIDHKYPPNIFYLSYGVAATMGMLAFMKITKIHTNRFIHKIGTHISKHSYELYFIHYIVLDAVLKLTGNTAFWSEPWMQSILVVAVSLSAGEILNKMKWPIKNK